MSNWPRIAIQRPSAHCALCTMNLLITIVSSYINIIYLISIVLSSLRSRCKPMRFCTWNAVGMLKELDTLIPWYLDTLILWKGKINHLIEKLQVPSNQLCKEICYHARCPTTIKYWLKQYNHSALWPLVALWLHWQSNERLRVQLVCDKSTALVSKMRVGTRSEIDPLHNVDFSAIYNDNNNK